MRSIFITAFIFLATVASCQLSTEDGILGRKYFNQGYQINQGTFEAIVKAEPEAWNEYKKSKKNRLFARIADAAGVGCIAYAYFGKKNPWYYPGIVAIVTGFAFDIKADNNIKSAIAITNSNMGFETSFLIRF